MAFKDGFLMDNTNNTLRYDPVDDDGFHVSEMEGEDKNKIYVYYSEIPGFIAGLKKVQKMKGKIHEK